MFNTIYVPVDNSEWSNRAVDLGVAIGEKFGSKMIGSHVYAAAMHDYRFKQMEYTLPGEYLQEQEIERQRVIHDSLITMGLELISDCYLNAMDERCKERGIELQRKMMDGKHHVEIVKDIAESEYDLTVIGVLGVGKTRDSQIGSVCERVVRNAEKDVLVVKHVPKDNEPERDTILVGIDGSPQSFGSLVTAIELARKFDKKIDLISVYDPYLHYAVFKSIVDVLTDKAAKVFRFEEQNQLHEEVIDTGLAQIYQSHLNIAASLAEEYGIEVSKTLLDGKAFQKILQHARKKPPWMLVIGRVGVHSVKGESGLGSNTENLLRLAPCDVLLTTKMEYPALDKKAEETIVWTAEAEEKMKRVPAIVKGIARRGILRLALEKGHSVITETVIEDAMERFMPKYTQKKTMELAQTLAYEKVKQSQAAMCVKCGVTASQADPEACSVCGGTEFEVLTPEILETLAKSQGGVEEDRTYDGKNLKWSKEARKELNSIEDKYQRRRAKARIEKGARLKKLDIITFEFARAVIDEDVGRTNAPLLNEYTATSSTGAEEPQESVLELKPLQRYDESQDVIVLAVDEKGEEFSSVYPWTKEALERILRVPGGFMRQKTQERVETIALKSGSLEVDLALVEAGIEVGRQMMEEAVSTMQEEAQAEAIAVEKKAEGKCPFSSMFEGEKGDQKEAFERLRAFYAEKGEPSVESISGSRKTESHVYDGAVRPVLNEAGLMHEIERRRAELSGEK